MCRFASARDEGYLTVSSFINRFAHYQTLKVGISSILLCRDCVHDFLLLRS